MLLYLLYMFFAGRGEIYVSNWYAYGAFSFLGDRNHPGNTQDTLGEEVST